MGNILTSNRDPNQEIIRSLQDRLTHLENIDKNIDSMLKHEFDVWTQRQNKIVDEEVSKHQKEIFAKDNEIRDLKREMNSLKSLLKNVRSPAGSLPGDFSGEVQVNRSTGGSVVSEEQIKKFVEELLTDETVNINYLPDWVERQLYINFFNILINVLKKTANTASFKFIGHELTLQMHPLDKSSDPSSNQSD